MAKKTKKIVENFLNSNIFTFESYACHCEMASVAHIISEEPLPALKLTADKDTVLKFAFGSKVGLVRINEDGSIAESNLLGKLLAVKEDDIEGYIDFFSRNGFLLPISTNTSETISLLDLQCITDRLQATLELMSTITDMSRTSYEKIVRMIFYHLFAPVISIETYDERYRYVSKQHKYTRFLEDNKDSKRDERLNDTFNNVDFDFSDNVGTFSLDADFVDSVLRGVIEDDEYENILFQEVFTAYCSPREGKSKIMLYINDFILHYFLEVGIIDHVDLKKTTYVNGINNQEQFSDKLKHMATEIGKYIVKEEIESNLKKVRPTYSISKLEPSWIIDSLLSALYFGLFYMRPNMETYRRCANPKCGNFFLVPVSSRKKKYCCKACMNRDMAARKRARDKLKQTART